MRCFVCYLTILVLFIFNVSVVNAEEKDKSNQEKKDTSKITENNNKQIYVVQNGDNIYRIALKYKITQKELMEANNLTGTNVFVGQKLKLPKNALLEEDLQKNRNNDINKEQNLKENDNKTDEKNEKLNRVEIADKQKKELNLVNKVGPTTFIWPSRGIITSKFGSTVKSGAKLEGVYIGGETGSAVKAVSSGEVTYNDKVEGFGNVIIIRHYNGFLTIYGHTDPFVNIHDKVKKGQVIAYMTKDKNSKRSILYFSIRKDGGGKVYDPEKLIQTKISN